MRVDPLESFSKPLTNYEAPQENGNDVLTNFFFHPRLNNCKGTYRGFKASLILAECHNSFRVSQPLAQPRYTSGLQCSAPHLPGRTERDPEPRLLYSFLQDLGLEPWVPKVTHTTTKNYRTTAVIIHVSTNTSWVWCCCQHCAIWMEPVSQSQQTRQGK